VDVLCPFPAGLQRAGKRFPDGTVALAGVDLSVAPDEFVSILGPSGCGKSTLLRVAAGLSQASDGTAKVGTDKIGYVFQDPTDTKVFYFQGDTYRSSARGLWPSGRRWIASWGRAAVTPTG
jgi:ABC-type oligopeptide transport system ATPase subunit